MFEETIKAGTQDRFLVAFAETCVTMPFGANPMVPSDAAMMCKDSANVAHHVLTRIAQQAVGLVNHVAKAMRGIDAKVSSFSPRFSCGVMLGTREGKKSMCVCVQPKKHQ